MLRAMHTQEQNQATKMPALITSEDNFLGHQRMRELELRVNQAEQSNRALLEELVRLQNDHKSYTRKTDQLLEEARQSSKKVEQTNQAMQQRLLELEDRNKRAEREVNETKNALAQLVNHTRSVERAVTSSQQDLLNKKEQSLLRVQELKQEVLQHVHSKEQLEKFLFTLREELQRLHARVEAQNIEISRVQNSVGSHIRVSEEIHHFDPTKQKLESTISQLHHSNLELQRQLEHEARTREIAEQALSNRIMDLTNLLAEQNRKREEMVHMIEIRYRDLTSHSDADKHKIQQRIEQTVDAVTNDVSSRESRLKQELFEKLYSLEKQISNDRQNKLHERTLRDELESKIHSSKKTLADDVTAVHSKLTSETKDIDIKIRELFKATNLLDQQVQQVREHSEHILGTENKSRKKSEKEIHKRIDECEDRLKTGMASLTDVITSIKNDPNNKITEVKIADLKIKEISQDKVDKVKKDLEKEMRQLDTKINEVEEKLFTYERNENRRLTQIANGSGDTLGDIEIKPKVETLTFEQQRLQRQLEELQNDVHRLPREVSDLESRLEKLERGSAKAATKNVQNQIDRTQTSIRKLAESVQVVKNILLDRIKEEETNRQRQTNILKNELLKLRQRVNGSH